MRVLGLTLLVAACGAPSIQESTNDPSPTSNTSNSEKKLGDGTNTVTTVERVLKDHTSWIALELNPSTVFCSEQGYGLQMLKVSIPDLDWLATFDHRVDASGLPCAQGGYCSPEYGPDAIIQGKPGADVVPLRVRLTERLEIDDAAQKCTRTQYEEIYADVRGVKLQHQRAGGQSVSYAVCNVLKDDPLAIVQP